jgi:prophage antirepressor-like protein
MSSIVKYACDELSGAEIECIIIEGEPWFKAKQVAQALGYSDTKQTIQTNVDDEDKKQYKHLVVRSQGGKNTPLGGTTSNAVFVNESGLYSLILRSNKPEAKVFKRWVTSEVLPSIRKTGSYALPPPAQPALVGKQIKLLNETDLHNKVVDLLRNTFPELKPVPGLGELQDTPIKRSDAYKKGYVGGQPDIMILNQTSKYNGFAIELKTPKGNGVIRDNQISYLDSLKDLKYKTLISNDYDEIVVELTRYYDDLRFPCPHCSKTFKSTRTRSGHIRACH